MTWLAGLEAAAFLPPLMRREITSAVAVAVAMSLALAQVQGSAGISLLAEGLVRVQERVESTRGWLDTTLEGAGLGNKAPAEAVEARMVTQDRRLEQLARVSRIAKACSAMKTKVGSAMRGKTWSTCRGLSSRNRLSEHGVASSPCLPS